MRKQRPGTGKKLKIAGAKIVKKHNFTLVDFLVILLYFILLVYFLGYAYGSQGMFRTIQKRQVQPNNTIFTISEAVNEAKQFRDQYFFRVPNSGTSIHTGGLFKMKTFMRYFLIFVSAAQFFLAIAFFQQWPFVVNIWPFEGTTPLTFMLISSIYAAAAASTLWAAVTENYAALAGIALDYMTILAPVAVLLFRLSTDTGNSQLTLFAFIAVIGALFGLGLYLWSRRFPLDRTIRLPGFVRWSFILFIIALLIVGGRLVLKVPNSIPWSITPELSVVIGWMFLGAGMYFVYGLVRPSWVNAAGQLIGFLAYDLVLILPFLSRLPATAPENRTGMIIYIVVITFSGLLAVYFLFIHPPTRLWSRMQASREPVAAK
jgi:hypothetical protein